MMNEQTLQKMKQMKFFGMVRAFQTSMENGSISSLIQDELISMLIEAEWDDRNNRRIQRHIRNARFRYVIFIWNFINGSGFCCN